jgi:threonine aldolase
MMDPRIDLRSDTVTRPTLAMRKVMAEAEVGDDVIDIDPSTERLQRRVAELLGKEASIFMPSGSMTNQIAIRVHCQPGDEFLCESDCHVYNYEQAAFAQLSGLVARTIQGQFGRLKREQFVGMIRPAGDHLVRTRLVCLENTHNRGGGTVQPYEEVEAICSWARSNGLATHLDGARLFNAAVASGISEMDWSKHFDTVSVCFSKGLGAPVGSVLAGPADFIKRARRVRKLFGGGMRQCGVLAAAALYALDHHRERLVEDHAHAQLLGGAVRQSPGLKLEPAEVETNIVIFRVHPNLGASAEFVAALEREGVRAMIFGPQLIRMVTHLDVDREAIQAACDAIERVAGRMADQAEKADHNCAV